MIVIVPYHNDEKRLENFVACLNAQTFKPFVLWVNSASKDGSWLITYSYTGPKHTIDLAKNAYWCGCLVAGQKFVAVQRPGHIIGVMNNDVEIAPDYFQTIRDNMAPGRIVSSAIYDAQSRILVQRGVRILWDRVFTRSYGVISTVPAFRAPYDAFRDSGVFVMQEDFLRVSFHARLLPHYQTDYYWTMSLIRSGLNAVVPKKLRLYLDFSATPGPATTVRGLFSKTCYDNPVFASNYVLLCAPWIWKLPNFIRVWGYAAVRMWRMIA